MKTGNTTPPPPISLEDFARIHGVLRTVLAGSGVSAADIGKSCIFFAVGGASLLIRKHGLCARPAAGAAFFAVAEGQSGLDVLAFAKRDELSGQWCSDIDAFHAWIEVTTDDGQVWIVDLTSPLYAQGIRKLRPGATAPDKAFVRPTQTMITHPDRLEIEGAAGDFFVSESKANTAHMMQKAAADLQLGDLVDVASHWYAPAPAVMPKKLLMGTSDGPAREMTFTQPRLAGYWPAPGQDGVAG